MREFPLAARSSESFYAPAGLPYVSAARAGGRARPALQLQARDLKNALKGLARHKRIVYLKKNHFALARGDGKTAGPDPYDEQSSKGDAASIDNRQSKIDNLRGRGRAAARTCSPAA